MKKTWLKTLKSLLLGAVFGGVGMVLGGLLPIPKELLTKQEAVLLLICLPVLAWFVIFVHEAGHALGGRLAGFRFFSLAAGPLRIERGRRSPIFRWNRFWQTWGGVNLSLPKDENDCTRGRFGLMVAGGPIASSVAAVLLWAMGSAYSQGLALALLWVSAFMSGLIGLVTLVPIRNSGGFTSDGAKLLDLSRGGKHAERVLTFSTLAAMQSAGVRPRDLPSSLFELEPSDLSEVENVSWLLAKSARLRDLGQIREAVHVLEPVRRDFDGLPSILRPHVAVWLAFLMAETGEVSIASEYLGQSEGWLVQPFQLALAKAALAVAQGDPKSAKHTADEGLATLEQCMFATEADREWLESYASNGLHLARQLNTLLA